MTNEFLILQFHLIIKAINMIYNTFQHLEDIILDHVINISIIIFLDIALIENDCITQLC